MTEVGGTLVLAVEVVLVDAEGGTYGCWITDGIPT